MSIDVFDISIASESVKLKIHILEAVNSLMLEKPFDKVTVSEICKRASISRQTFYNHFHDKTDLAAWLEAGIVNVRLTQIGISLDWESAINHILVDLTSNASALAYGMLKISDRRSFTCACAKLISQGLIEELEWRRGVTMTQTLRFQCATFPHVMINVFDALFIDAAVPDLIDLDYNEPFDGSEESNRKRQLIAKNFLSYVPTELKEALNRKRFDKSAMDAIPKPKR